MNTNSSPLKVPPHSLDAEKSLLGSLLLEKDSIIKVADLVSGEDFYHEGHRLIYEVVFELFQKRTPIDLLTVSAALNDKGHLETIGGKSYLAEIVDNVVTAAHIYQYGVIVKHKATLRKLISAGDHIKGLGFDETGDIEDILEEAEKDLFGVSQTFVRDKFMHIKDILAKTYEKITDLHDPDAKEKYRGIPMGFDGLDRILSGLQPSDMIVIAARPAMGKTALALNIAQNVAKTGKSVGIMSLEMSKGQLVERMFCSLLQVDSWKMRTGQLTEADFARIGPVMDELNKYKIFIDDSIGNSLPELRAKARRLQMEHGLDVIVIDYLQLMTSGKAGGNFNNRVNEISEISRSLKALARELHVPIIALSQLSRAVEQRPNKIPILSDLRESGAIEQDADVVMMMYREDYYEEDSDRPGLTDIYIRKHRNGKTGRVELMFKKEQMKFYDIDRVHEV
jgi:replicative DNA helicase